jgi:3-oxocholest-4-en-26-oate---CoA ligase
MHFADIFEAVADARAGREALICGDTRRSWSEFDDRAARLNSALLEAGLKPGSKVGFYLYNGNEYCETYIATLKLRGVAVNINYRYVEEELRYILDYSDAEALVYDSSLSERVSKVIPHLPRLKLLIEVGGDHKRLDESTAYEQLIASHSPAARIERPDDDPFMNFTGGTTGTPKGVIYRMGDVADYLASRMPALQGMDSQFSGVADVVEFAQLLERDDLVPTSLPASPLMHTAGLMCGFLSHLVTGARIVTLPNHSFDAHAILQAIARERVTFTTFVGDPFCKPILRALDEARDKGSPYDLSSLRIILSSGLAWSQQSKRRLLEYADLTLIDAMGATEGNMAVSMANRQTPPADSGKFQMMADTRLFDSGDREIQPGSGEIGHIAAGGVFVPLAYYKDVENSAKTFRTINGKRYAFIGDMGIVEKDGTLILLGRGSNCINTGGEKVFPEEVETVLATHPDVNDCLVLGIADPHFGQQVAAIIATGNVDPDLSEKIVSYCREKLAGYKCPRLIRIANEIHRSANGKADYLWARRLLDD